MQAGLTDGNECVGEGLNIGIQVVRLGHCGEVTQAGHDLVRQLHARGHDLLLAGHHVTCEEWQ